MGQINIYNDAGTNKLALTYTGQGDSSVNTSLLTGLEDNVQTLLNTKANQSTTYTKTEVNTSLALKANVASPVFTGNIETYTSGSNIYWNTFRNDYNAASTGYGVGLKLKLSNDTTGEINKWCGIVGVASTNYSNMMDMAFYTANVGSGVPTEKMRINSTGIVTKPYQPAFYAGKSGESSTITNFSINDVLFDYTKYNIGGHYSTSTGRFTAPVAGLYAFRVHIVLSTGGFNSIVGGADGLLGISVNGSTYNQGGSGDNYGPVWIGYYANAERVIFAILSAGDYVQCRFRVTDSDKSLRNDMCSFSGYLIG